MPRARQPSKTDPEATKKKRRKKVGAKNKKGSLHKGVTRFRLHPKAAKEGLREPRLQHRLKEVEQQRSLHLSNDNLGNQQIQFLKRGLVLFTTTRPPRQLETLDERELAVARSVGRSTHLEHPARFQAATAPVRNYANDVLQNLAIPHYPHRTPEPNRGSSPELKLGIGPEHAVTMDTSTIPPSMFEVLPNRRDLALKHGDLKHHYMPRRSKKSPNLPVPVSLKRHLLQQSRPTTSAGLTPGEDRSSTTAAGNRMRHLDDCTGVNAGASSFRFTRGRDLDPKNLRQNTGR